MAALSVAYEAPSRRMAYRVTAPAMATIQGRGYRTKDWSTGGFSTEEYDGPARPGDRVRIGFAVDFQGFAVSFAGEARVARRDGKRLAAEFIRLGERERGLLRYFSSALVSGQTVLLAGLISEREQNTRAGIPGLRDIKFLGDLFGNTSGTKQRSEIIIFIRTRLMRNSIDASSVTEEFREKLQLMRSARGVVEGAAVTPASSPPPPRKK